MWEKGIQGLEMSKPGQLNLTVVYLSSDCGSVRLTVLLFCQSDCGSVSLTDGSVKSDCGSISLTVSLTLDLFWRV